jgi:hypothetical protein
MFDSDEKVGGDIFKDGDDDGNEIAEIDVKAIRFCYYPMSLVVLALGFSFRVNFQTVCLQGSHVCSAVTSASKQDTCLIREVNCE